MRPMLRALIAVPVDTALQESVWTVRCYRVWGLYQTSLTIPSREPIDALLAKLVKNQILTDGNASCVVMDITVQMGSADCAHLVL